MENLRTFLLPPAYVVRGKVIFIWECLSVHTWERTSILPNRGYPMQSWWREGVSHPRSGQGVPKSQLRTGVPNSRSGVPSPPISRMGYPLSRSGPRMGDTPNWNSIACTCYAASGMPFAFTQEDFLVENNTILKIDSKMRPSCWCSHSWISGYLISLPWWRSTASFI